MRTESQRAQPRVDYAMDVHILRPGGRTPIRARSLNLSPTGVFLEAENRASNDCPVGTQLLCDIPLPGGRRYLKGRVARTQSMPSSATGLGISFENLEAADQAILHALVQNTADHCRLVKVRFEGMDEALRSRAVVTKDGLRLQTALPFLRLDSPVDVSFIAGASRVQTHGTLERVHLEPELVDGIPRLAVDVALPETAGPFTNEFLSDHHLDAGEFGPDDTTAPGVSGKSAVQESLPAVEPEPPFSPSPSAPTLVLHKSAVQEDEAAPPQVTDAGRGLLGGNLGSTLLLPVRSPRRRQPTRVRERRPPPAPKTPLPSRIAEAALPNQPNSESVVPPLLRPVNPWWWTWGWPALGAILAVALIYDRLMVGHRIAAQLAEQGQEIQSARSDLAETRSLARQAKGAAEATQAATLGLRSVIHREIFTAFERQGSQGSNKHASEPALLSSSKVALAPAAPKLQVVGNTATASVQITGSTKSMIHYSLASPTGVVIRLPHAKSVPPLGHYRIKEGGFSAVWVDMLPGGLAIRFVYDSTNPLQEMLEVVQERTDQTAGPGLAKSEGSVRVRLRRL